MPPDPTLPSPGRDIWRQALLTSSLDGVMLMAASGEVLDFNDEAARIFGLTRETAIGRPLSELIVPPDLRAAHRAGLRRFLETRESRIIGRRIEVDAMRSDGFRFPVELTIAVLQEEPPIFIAHLRDIQSRVQAERRLRATAAVSQALAAAGTAEQAIHATLRALGESLGWHVLQFWRVPATGPTVQLVARWPSEQYQALGALAFARGEGLPGLVWDTREPQWLEDVASRTSLPRYDGLLSAGVQTALAFPVRVHGRVTAIIEAFTREALPKEPELLAVLAALGGQLGHLLQEIEARAETARARDQAEEANRLKDEFLSMASHELRTPLNALIGWVHLIRQGRLSGDALARAIDAIDRNAAAQARLVNDLLDMSRIITGKFQLDLNVVDPREILSAALDVVKPAADAKEIRISVTQPEGDTPRLYADAGRLQQVFWNVLSNAVKFTPRSGAIDVRLAFDQDTMQVIVRDTGAGIPPEFLPRIFERFAQASTTSPTATGGLGLGLSIAKQFMDLHGGSIHITSPGIDQGTEVLLTLPTAAGSAKAEQIRRHAGNRLAGIRVLLVDDDARRRERIRALLGAGGGTIDTAASVEEALGCLSQAHFDVVVCTMRLPDGSSTWLGAELQTHPPRKSSGVGRVAVCDGTALQRAEALDAGFEEVVDEPLDPQRLVDAVLKVNRSA